MQAMHGFAALFRSRTRLIGCAMATVLALSALVLASTASAAEPPHKTYLAAGDSLAFGYSQEIFNENYPTEPPKAFEHGYVNDYFLKLKAKQVTGSNWNNPINDGCPGETTDSMIGNGPLERQMVALGAVGAPACAYHNVTKFHLHHEYGGAFNFEGKQTFRSQLENVLQVIQANNHDLKSDHPVTLVSLNIGANDLLAGVHKCEAEVKEEFEKEGKSKYGATPEEAVKTCLEAHAGEIFQHVLKNIGAALYVIRNGSMFCVNVNKLNPPPMAPCDPKHKGVNYTGKIIFNGYYDPYGAVFTPGVELLPSSNVLQLLLNFQAKKLVNSFLGCYANPQQAPADQLTMTENLKSWNPALTGEPLDEPRRLQTWTNMANFTFAKNGNKAKNGPDIHPTPTGYQELAQIMEDECP